MRGSLSSSFTTSSTSDFTAGGRYPYCFFPEHFCRRWASSDRSWPMRWVSRVPVCISETNWRITSPASLVRLSRRWVCRW